MNIKKVDDKPMVIHTKEKTKLHVKTAPETKIKAGNVLTVERTPKFAGAEREAKADNMDKRMSALKVNLYKSCNSLQWQTEREESMQYSIKINAVNNPKKSVKAFATVTFGDCFKVTNIAVVVGVENQPFVSMPSFKTKERTERNEPVYKDVCNPITSEFRKDLYDDILSLYGEMEQSGKTEVSRVAENAGESEFRVAVTPFEREGSNIRGLARIYFEDSFVVSNVSIIQGKEKEFVAMPSYMVK